MKNSNIKVYLSAVLYAVIVGLSFLFGKVGLETTDPIDLLAHRFTASFIAILISVLFGWVKLNYNKESIIKILPLALLYPLAFFGLQTFGLQYASSSEAGILLAVSPVFTLILATYFLNEDTSFLQKLSILLSVSGVIYITLKKGESLDFNNLKGIILLILSALSMSGYSVMARDLTQNFSSIELSYMMNIISFIFFNIISLGKHLIRGSLTQFLTPLVSPSFLTSIFYLGVLSSLGTSLLTNYVLSKIEASKMIVFSNLGTVISIVAGVVFLKEEIFYYHILGSILIVGGVIGANFLDKDRLKSKE